MKTVYVLRCYDNKYYVGETSDVDRRLAEHLAGRGSEWTRHYPPEEVIEVKDVTSTFQEMNTTLEYMRKHGIDHVRGAQWARVTLTEEERSAILKAIYPNACFHCGGNGHFADRCPDRTVQTAQCFTCNEQGHYANQCRRKYNPVQCRRCGRNSHGTSDCFATTDVDGDMLPCARCGRESHDERDCYARTNVHGHRLS